MKKGGKNIFTYLLAMILSAWTTFTFLLVGGMYEASDTYDQNQAQMAAQPITPPVRTVTFTGANNAQLKLRIPSQKLLYGSFLTISYKSYLNFITWSLATNSSRKVWVAKDIGIINLFDDIANF